MYGNPVVRAREEKLRQRRLAMGLLPEAPPSGRPHPEPSPTPSDDESDSTGTSGRQHGQPITRSYLSTGHALSAQGVQPGLGHQIQP